MKYNKIIDLLVSANKEDLIMAIAESLEQNVSPTDILEKGLSKGMEIVGKKFETGELYLPDMILSAEAMNEAVNMLKSHFKEFTGIIKNKKFLIGTVKGDIHDIGKSIVSTFLDVSGFEVIDLGTNVPTNVFIEKAEELQVDIIGLSALMTTTIFNMQDIIRELESIGLRDKYKIIVGGGSVTEEFANLIGADGHGDNFSEAVRVAKQLTDS